MQGGKNRQLGYTIIEVMIVLAVSGVMFLIGSTFISGKQEQASFTAGINSMATAIQNVIEQVTDGQYSDVPLNCSVNTNTLQFSSTGSVNVQGTNSLCIFRGKVIHFYGSPTSNYEVINLADARADSAAENGYVNSSVKGVPGLTTQAVVPETLYITDFKVNGSVSNNYNLAILQSLGVANTSGGYQSGAQSIELANSTTLSSASPAKGSETSIIGGNPIMPLINSASICFSDGTQYGLIDLGVSGGSPVSVNIKKYGKNPC